MIKSRKILFLKKNYGGHLTRNGYVLPLVILTGMILVIGAAILSAESFSGLIRSTRQKQADEAVEIAETGTTLLINELNNNFPYLLTVNCKVENNSALEQMQKPNCVGWKEFKIGQSGGFDSECPARSDDPSQVMDLLYTSLANRRGSYRLRNYEFLGDQIQGGKAIIQVQGQRFKGASESSGLAASAIVEQEITIAPKCCGKPPFVDLEQCASGNKKILGLLTNQLTNLDTGTKTRKGLDIFGDSHIVSNCPPGMKGSISTGCTDTWRCEDILDIPKGQITRSDAGEKELCSYVSGENSYGPREIPIAPTWNEAGENQNPPQDNWNSRSAWIIRNSNETVGHDTHPDHCVTTTGPDNKKTTSCRIWLMEYSAGFSLKLDPGDGYINFYLDGGANTGEKMSFSGENIVNNGNPDQFSIIVGPKVLYPGTSDETKKCAGSGKMIDISGTGTINAFIYAPCAIVKASGAPIDFNGNIISREFASNNNDIRINTPEGDYGSEICERFDLDICTESDPTGEFAALGSNRWSLIQMEQE